MQRNRPDRPDMRVSGNLRLPSARRGALRHATMLIMFLAMIAGISRSLAQTSPTDGATAALKIVFLHQLHRYADADEDSQIRLASRLGLPRADLAAIFAAARSFASAERQLMLDAKAYRQRQNASGRPLDIRIIQEFTARRYAIARSVIDSLHTELPQTSYLAVQRFLVNEFPKSVVSWR
jgi:hypothetical protein